MSDVSSREKTNSQPTSDEAQDNGPNGEPNGDQGGDGSGDESSQEQDKNWLEWAVTGAGALVVLFVLGFLTYQYIWGSDEPAELVVELGAQTVDGQTVEIPVTVRNTGDRVASAVIVEVCSGEACAELTFDYIPFASRRAGSVGLKAPLEAPLDTRVVSFRTP